MEVWRWDYSNTKLITIVVSPISNRESSETVPSCVNPETNQLKLGSPSTSISRTPFHMSLKHVGVGRKSRSKGRKSEV